MGSTSADTDRIAARQPSPEIPRANAWQRWLVPPIRDVIFVPLFLSFCFGNLAQRLLRDGGTGWHIRTGQRILFTHQIPRTDPFSLTTSGKPWFAWEWLYDAGLGLIYNHAGLNGTVAATAFVIALTFTGLFSLMRKRGSDLLTALCLLLLALASAALHLYVRPHILSWLFTLVWWLVLERAREKQGVWLLVLLPLLTIVWVNIHGGFLFGFALLAVYDLEALWLFVQEKNSWTKRWLSGVALATVGAVTGSLLNPYGASLYTHIYQYLTDKFLMQHIQEFQAPNFHDLSPICFALLLAVAAAGIAFASRKPNLREIGVMLLCAGAGLYASRNLPVSAMLIALLASPYVSLAFRQRVLKRHDGENGTILDRLGSRDSQFAGGFWPAAALLVMSYIVLHNGYVGSTRLMNAEFDDHRFPVAAVNDLETRQIRDPLFCVDQWGGYLIYRNYPAVLVDDRHDLYGDEFFKRYLTIVRGDSGWQAALDQTGARLVLIPVASKLATNLRSDQGWKVEYQDSVAALFERIRE